MARAAREMRDTEELQLIVCHGEHRVVPEIDALDVLVHRVAAERRAEAQAPVLRSKGEEMVAQTRAFSSRQLADGNIHARLTQVCSSYARRPKAFRAAASVASISAAPCAAETKPASYAEGARYTPCSSIAWKKRLKRSRSHCMTSAKLRGGLSRK